MSEKFALPYNADIGVLSKILADLKNTGGEGINLETLWVNINQSTDPSRSYTLNLAKYLQLVDTDKTKVWLTPLGRSIGYLPQDKRNAELIRNLPAEYSAMIKWLLYATDGEMYANDFKATYSRNYGAPGSTLLLDRAVATFLKYCEWISLVAYRGKGRGAKAAITDFGKKVLNEPAVLGPTSISPASSSAQNSTANLSQEKQPLSDVHIKSNATSVVKIIARIGGKDKPEYEVELEGLSDWNAISAHIRALQEKWEKENKEVKITKI